MHGLIPQVERSAGFPKREANVRVLRYPEAVRCEPRCRANEPLVELANDEPGGEVLVHLEDVVLGARIVVVPGCVCPAGLCSSQMWRQTVEMRVAHVPYRIHFMNSLNRRSSLRATVASQLAWKITLAVYSRHVSTSEGLKLQTAY